MKRKTVNIDWSAISNLSKYPKWKKFISRLDTRRLIIKINQAWSLFLIIDIFHFQRMCRNIVQNQNSQLFHLSKMKKQCKNNFYEGKEDVDLVNLCHTFGLYARDSYFQFVSHKKKKFQNELIDNVLKQAQAIFKFLNRAHIERISSMISIYGNENLKQQTQTVLKPPQKMRRPNKMGSLKLIHTFSLSAKKLRNEQQCPKNVDALGKISEEPKDMSICRNSPEPLPLIKSQTLHIPLELNKERIMRALFKEYYKSSSTLESLISMNFDRFTDLLSEIINNKKIDKIEPVVVEQKKKRLNLDLLSEEVEISQEIKSISQDSDREPPSPDKVLSSASNQDSSDSKNGSLNMSSTNKIINFYPREANKENQTEESLEWQDAD
ncbi:unnamed protein product [Moneuplotes crassus]|uniref:Uncharacterized protein n=1 Tax=Euplotes crassus TaxID=5936 RepID=A0AAD1UL82_EUPCR|nr:unnamed protein product [Moneuplotes crassus]